MIYFLYGSDHQAARHKLNALSKTLQSKRPGSEFFRLHDENWNEATFEELLIAQGLFDQKYIVVLDNLLEDKAIREKVLDHMKDMQTSEHVFLILDGDLDKKTIDKISKYAEKVQEFAEKNPTVGKVERFNTFSLADALARKDKKHLWIGFLKALETGISAEEIAGVLFWQLKSLLLVKKTKTAKESKLSPFADSKARSFAKNFSEQDIRMLSDHIVKASVAVREGKGEMEVFLEKIILSL